MKARRRESSHIRRPTHSHKRMRKRKSACSVRSRNGIRDAETANDGVQRGRPDEDGGIKPSLQETSRAEN
jgi:hypothetical protein